MTGKQAKLISQDEQLRKRLAKFLALHCFRNTELENLHAGIVPSSKTGDYSDVKVVTPYGEIPWAELSRFDDDEMKRLMIDVVNQTYTWLTVLFCEDRIAQGIIEVLQSVDVQPRWNEPQHIP
ncbi:MAG: hypothetical protein EHM61_23430 [Acidobacteria bacterium]|nr:MAG: hypothetical protein EHM61_23430 [Acidobacteriota bacterium]